jgi:hypothetical protein
MVMVVFEELTVVFWTFLVLRSVACLLSDDRIRVQLDKWMFNSYTPFLAR